MLATQVVLLAIAAVAAGPVVQKLTAAHHMLLQAKKEILEMKKPRFAGEAGSKDSLPAGKPIGKHVPAGARGQFAHHPTRAAVGRATPQPAVIHRQSERLRAQPGSEK